MPYSYDLYNSVDNGRLNTEQKNIPSYLSAAGATQLAVGQGYVDLISGIQGTGAINIYDLAAGTTASLASQIGTFPASSLTVAATAVQPPATVYIHGQYLNGLYVNLVSSATVAQATLSHT